MPRWRQCSKTHKMIPIDEAAAKRDGVAIHGDIEPFVSPVDGTVINDRRQLREHNIRNGVVNSGEFSAEFYERKAQERADHYQGRSSREETLARKRELYEIANQLERSGKHGN